MVNKLRLSDIEFNVATLMTKKVFQDYERVNQSPLTFMCGFSLWANSTEAISPFIE